MKDIRTTGERIADLIREKGTTAKQIAEETGLSPSTISDLKNDKDRNVSNKAIIALAKHFNVSSDYLLCLSDYPTVSQSIKNAARTTGLSSEAVDNLNKWKNKGLRQPYWTNTGFKEYSVGYDHVEMIEILATTEDGIRLLKILEEYLKIDFTEAYITNEDGELVNYNHFIEFRNIDGTKTGFKPEMMAVSMMNSITSAINNLKTSYIKTRR